jgi:flagellar M-ring protein FliF
MDGLKSFFTNIGDFVGRMTASQVMMLLGVSAGTVVGIFFLVGWLNSVQYTRLYSNMEEEEAGEVLAYLRDAKVEYRLLDGGRTIEVPSTDVYQTRIALATEGLPRAGSVGYSIFDQNNLGMTDFLQNLNFRRALEGELTRTIMQLDEVQAARVHIVMPKDRLFKQDQKKTTASVVLKTKGNGKLDERQIAGITHLVASSVEGLEPDKITVLDYGGNLLSSGQSSDPSIGLSSSQLQIAQRVENHLQSKAQSMLDQVLGADRSVVRVTASLDFQQLERTSEIYDPNSPSVRSEERVKSTGKESDKANESSESEREDSEETTRTNYELNRTVEHAVNAVGSIDRLSVAVLVDGTFIEEVAEDGTVTSVYQPRSSEELSRLESIVKNAVGFESDRNDQVEIVNIAFDRQDVQGDREALDAMYEREFYYQIGTKIGYFLLIAFILLYFRKKARNLFEALGRIAGPIAPVQPEGAEPLIPEEEEEEVIVKPIKRAPTLTHQLQEMAKQDPVEAAKAIRTMMVE